MSTLNIPDEISERMSQAAQAELDARGIDATTNALARAEEKGVSQAVLEWQRLRVKGEFAQNKAQQVWIEGGDSSSQLMGFIAQLVKSLKGGD